MTTKVGTKGQVVIEKPIRDRLGIEPGHVTLQEVVGDHLEIRFFPPDHERSLKGILATETDQRLETDSATWLQARETAWRSSIHQANRTEVD